MVSLVQTNSTISMSLLRYRFQIFAHEIDIFRWLFFSVEYDEGMVWT
jgi:hypothetical protein